MRPRLVSWKTLGLLLGCALVDFYGACFLRIRAHLLGRCKMLPSFLTHYYEAERGPFKQRRIAKELGINRETIGLRRSNSLLDPCWRNWSQFIKKR
jgi:hypothetical protein